MDFFKSKKDIRITIVTDLALFLLSSLAAVLMCVETVPALSILVYVLLCALFAAVPILCTGVISCSVSACATIAPAIVASIVFLEYSPIIVTAILMLAGFLISFFHAKGAPRLYPIVSSSFAVCAVVMTVFVLFIIEIYGTFSFANVSKLFDEIDESVVSAFTQMKEAFKDAPQELSGYFEFDANLIRSYMFRFRITGFVSAVLSFCFFVSYFITSIYRIFVKKAFPELYDFPEDWRLRTPLSVRVMYIVSMIIGIFTVGNYTSVQDVNGFFPVLFVALFNIGELFGSVLFVEGIFALRDILYAVKNRTGKNYVPVAVIAIIVMLFFYPQLPILLITWLGFGSGRPRFRRIDSNGDNNKGGE